jgi:hypothetical protein
MRAVEGASESFPCLFSASQSQNAVKLTDAPFKGRRRGCSISLTSFLETTVRLYSSSERVIC